MKDQLNFLPTLIENLREPLSRAFTAISAAAVLITVASCSSVEVPAGDDLKGTWRQTGAGYEQGRPVNWGNHIVVIEKASGQGFAGFKEYKRDGEQPQKEALNGVIGLDGNVLIVDEDGTFEGRFVGGKLRGQYAEVGGGDAAAINVELTRK